MALPNYSTLAYHELDVIEIDVFTGLNQVAADPASFGLVNVTDACFDGTGIVGNPDDYLFWDSVHPTTKGHQVIANMVFGELLTQEPLVQSDTATVTISVADATTPVAVVDTNLYVGGTAGADTIVVREARPGSIYVQVNAHLLGPYLLGPEACVVVFGHDGDDWIDASRLNRSAVLFGGSGRDVLFGGRGSDILRGDSGNDFLYGRAGDDTLFGDDGRDSMFGGLGEDVLYGGNGNDFLFGGRGNDVLFGNAGNDWLFGQLGDDELDGGDGFDWLFGGPGLDTLLYGERSFS